MVVYTFKILLLGPSAVGKTSLLFRFAKDTFSDFKPTLGVDFMVKEVQLGEHTVKLSIWDIGGHERFEILHKMYYQNAQGALMVFDLTREDTFKEIEDWYYGMDKILQKRIPSLLIGNKLDLIKRKKYKIDPDAIDMYSKRRESLYLQTSAKTGKNVEKAFVQLTQIMVDLYDDIIDVDQEKDVPRVGNDDDIKIL